MKDNRTLLQGNHWQININLRYGVPGYPSMQWQHMEMKWGTGDYAKFPSQYALWFERDFECGAGKPEKLAQFCEFSRHDIAELVGATINVGHKQIREGFGKTRDYHALQALNPEGYPAVPDAAELIAYVWREFCFSGISPVEFDASTIADDLQSYLITNHKRFTKA